MKKYLTLNQEEQIAKNASDIQAIIDGSLILGELGIKVVGNVATASELPDPTTYLGAYGDAYLVGTTTPYDYYIFTRPFVGETDPQWFNIGQFPLAGPQGPQGPAGAVTRGDRGSMWYVGTVEPGLFSPGVYDTQTFNAQDMYLNSTTGIIYQYTGTQWQPKGNIIGPQGSVGARGQRGSKWYSGATTPGQASLSGVQPGDMYLETDNGNIYQTAGGGWVRISNIKGPQGEQGKNAVAVIIQSELESTDQLPPPDSTDRTNAYIIDIDGVFHLFVITEDSEGALIWTDMGPHGGTQIFVSGQSVDTWNADTKLDKETYSDGYAHLYAVDGNKQTTFKLSSSGFASTVALRSTKGTIKGATPIEDNDLTTKAYVDNAVANAGGSGGPTLRSMPIKINTAWLAGIELGWSTKEGHGPPISKAPVEPIPEAGLFALNGAWSSAGYGKLYLNTPDTNFVLEKYLTLDVVAFNNIAGLSTQDDVVLCRSYFTCDSVIETNEYGSVLSGTLYFYA